MVFGFWKKKEENKEKAPIEPAENKNDQPSSNALEITPKEVKEKIDSGEVLLIDVREPWENDAAKIEGSNLIPLGELSARMDELPKNIFIVTYCHHGDRSLMAAKMLSAAGFHAKSMKGGIDEWSKQVDQSVPRYG